MHGNDLLQAEVLWERLLQNVCFESSTRKNVVLKIELLRIVLLQGGVLHVVVFRVVVLQIELLGIVVLQGGVLHVVAVRVVVLQIKLRGTVLPQGGIFHVVISMAAENGLRDPLWDPGGALKEKRQMWKVDVKFISIKCSQMPDMEYDHYLVKSASAPSALLNHFPLFLQGALPLR